MLNELRVLAIILLRQNMFKIAKYLNIAMIIAFPAWVAYNLYEIYYLDSSWSVSFVAFFFINLYLITMNHKKIKQLRKDHE